MQLLYLWKRFVFKRMKIQDFYSTVIEISRKTFETLSVKVSRNPVGTIRALSVAFQSPCPFHRVTCWAAGLWSTSRYWTTGSTETEDQGGSG